MSATCALCGEPMPPGEEMFTYHGYSGNCPKPPKARAMGSATGDALNAVLTETAEALGCAPDNEEILDAIMALKAPTSADAVLAQQCARFEELWFELLEADIPDARASFDKAVADAVRAAYEHAALIAENHKRDASFDDSMAGALEHNSNQANIAAAIRAAIPAQQEETK